MRHRRCARTSVLQLDKGSEVVLPTSTDFITIAPATCSTEGLSRDTTESRSAPVPTMASTVHTAIVNIVPVLAAPAASDGTLDGPDTSGVASTPATCSMVCLHQHRVADPYWLRPRHQLRLSTSSTPTTKLPRPTPTVASRRCQRQRAQSVTRTPCSHLWVTPPWNFYGEWLLRPSPCPQRPRALPHR